MHTCVCIWMGEGIIPQIQTIKAFETILGRVDSRRVDEQLQHNIFAL